MKPTQKQSRFQPLHSTVAGDIEMYGISGEPNPRLPLDVLLAGRGEWRPGEALTWHSLASWDVEITVGGRGMFETGGTTFNVATGDVFIMRPHTQVAYRTAPGSAAWKKYFVDLSVENAGKTLAMLGLNQAMHIHLSPAGFAHAKKLMREMLAVLRHGLPRQRERTSILAYDLLLTLARETQATHAEPVVPPAVLTAVNFAQDHLREPLHAAVVARAAGLSLRHLNRLFQSAYGVNVHGWLVRTRVEQARALLTHTNQSVAQIAEALGYLDPAYFIAVFRRATNTTPRAYRASSRGLKCARVLRLTRMHVRAAECAASSRGAQPAQGATSNQEA